MFSAQKMALHAVIFFQPAAIPCTIEAYTIEFKDRMFRIYLWSLVWLRRPCGWHISQCIVCAATEVCCAAIVSTLSAVTAVQASTMVYVYNCVKNLFNVQVSSKVEHRLLCISADAGTEN